ncbi:hypothetical protein CN335_22805 [Bacillus thuringiensis]|uniref:DUF6440 domain-containing protein n=1 Tax=Bacillus cereus TaxID=1396 RepID=A0A9X0SKV1_BACCE|nr:MULTISPECIES: DUF6440 family protein [Bacillus cereus group]KXY30091.1 hypothetical protein AT268_17440 [Bacillus cereus]PEV32698.1 hypothetical protein CN430_02005 [Bacillus cereus]PFF32283.1 hypothetical protein CN335_22805 [Bacillus thuringiensis]PFI14590.1 hypothetical protein COI71_23185 [Bacillus cereus]
MKKLLMLLSLMLAVGCEKEDPPTNADKSNSTEYIKVFVDKETGCEYLHKSEGAGYQGYGGMTIRLDESGKPKGCKKIS